MRLDREDINRAVYNKRPVAILRGAAARMAIAPTDRAAAV
jgi:hypothetical protein